MAGVVVEVAEVERESLELRASGIGPLSIRVRLSKKAIYVSVAEIRAVLARHGAVPRSELTTSTAKGRLSGFWSPPKA
ncbi:MAG: hypothetical protein ACO3JL_16630 [Myxococcota bacterium]